MLAFSSVISFVDVPGRQRTLVYVPPPKPASSPGHPLAQPRPSAGFPPSLTHDPSVPALVVFTPELSRGNPYLITENELLCFRLSVDL